MLRAIQVKWYIFSVVGGEETCIKAERGRIHRAMREGDGGKSRDKGKEGVREKSGLCEACRLQPRYR